MSKKQKKLISIAAVCLLLSAIIFYYNNIRIPKIIENVENSVKKEIDIEAMPKRDVAIIIDKNGIDKYTILTDEVIKSKIEIRQLPEPFIVEGSITDLKDLKEKVAKENLRYGEQIHYDVLSNKSKWYGDYDRLKEYRVKTLVADTVYEGNLVDVIVNYGNGDYDVVLPKTKVIKIISPFEVTLQDSADGDAAVKNNPAKRTDEDKEFIVVFSVKGEDDYKVLNLASELGYFEVRKYVDERQSASVRTFDYEKTIEMLELKQITLKPNIEVENVESAENVSSEKEDNKKILKDENDEGKIEKER
ncbi:hypothetical protein R9X47_00840 [Wukongibacter baidiensis]|uniref:hypothetical protein n=1 Tax=Wukongibacter baidiensis TaxID=1723361 RepID=UPI003D7F1D5D